MLVRTLLHIGVSFERFFPLCDVLSDLVARDFASVELLDDVVRVETEEHDENASSHGSLLVVGVWFEVCRWAGGGDSVPQVTLVV